MIKIKKYKVRESGLRGRAISLPKVWVDDVGLRPGDIVNFYRDEKDRLILEADKHGGEDKGPR